MQHEWRHEVETTLDSVLTRHARAVQCVFLDHLDCVEGLKGKGVHDETSCYHDYEFTVSEFT